MDGLKQQAANLKDAQALARLQEKEMQLQVVDNLLEWLDMEQME